MQKLLLKLLEPGHVQYKCFYPVLQAFGLHVYRICAVALQANCVGDCKAAYLNESRSYRIAWF